MVGSYGKCTFNLRNCQTVFHFIYSPVVYESSSLSTFLPTLVVIGLFNLRYSNTHTHSVLLMSCQRNLCLTQTTVVFFYKFDSYGFYI